MLRRVVLGVLFGGLAGFGYHLLMRAAGSG